MMIYLPCRLTCMKASLVCREQDRVMIFLLCRLRYIEEWSLNAADQNGCVLNASLVSSPESEWLQSVFWWVRSFQCFFARTLFRFTISMKGIIWRCWGWFSNRWWHWKGNFTCAVQNFNCLTMVWSILDRRNGPKNSPHGQFWRAFRHPRSVREIITCSLLLFSPSVCIVSFCCFTICIVSSCCFSVCIVSFCCFFVCIVLLCCFLRLHASFCSFSVCVCRFELLIVIMSILLQFLEQTCVVNLCLSDMSCNFWWSLGNSLFALPTQSLSSLSWCSGLISFFCVAPTLFHFSVHAISDRCCSARASMDSSDARICSCFHFLIYSCLQFARMTSRAGRPTRLQSWDSWNRRDVRDWFNLCLPPVANHQDHVACWSPYFFSIPRQSNWRVLLIPFLCVTLLQRSARIVSRFDNLRW